MIEEIDAKTIITKKKDTFWFGADYNMNLYKGCCHGCIYCDSRSDCYQNGDFDQVRVKKDALMIVRNELRRKVRSGVIATGAMSDPYNPFERELELTRHALELISAYGFGIAVATKSDLIVRDMDLFQEIKEHSPVIAKITITSADDDLAKRVEPRAPLSSQRFEAIRKLSKQGIFSGVLLMPVLPFLEDKEENIVEIVQKTYDSGGRFIFAMFGMTLRDGQREYYYQKLDEICPGLKERYIRRYGNAYECRSPQWKKLWNVFCEQCEKYGILYNMKEIIRAYKTGYGDSQLSFLKD